MRSATSVALLTLSYITATSAIGNMGSDFVQGFETGMMQRNNEEVFEEYGCEPAEGSNKHLDAFINMFQSIKKFNKGMPMGKGKEFDIFFDSVTMFLDHVGSLQSIIFDYDGSEYCTGLNFGINGAGLLTNLAQTIAFVDEHNDGDANAPTSYNKFAFAD